MSREARSLHLKSTYKVVVLAMHRRHLQQLVVLAVNIIAQQAARASLAAVGSHLGCLLCGRLIRLGGAQHCSSLIPARL